MCTEMTSFNQPDGWISVKDNLPDTIRLVIVHTEWGGVCRGWYNPELQVWFDIWNNN